MCGPGFRYLAKALTSVLQNAGRSSGFRLDTKVFAPARTFDDLVVDPVGAGVDEVGLYAGPGGHGAAAHHVGSISVHGPWQITATGLPASKKPFANATAAVLVRRLSGGLATPPGSTRAA